MISSTPIPFLEALAAAQARSLLPTGANAAELEELDPAIRSRAWFSARVDNARYLDSIASTVTRLVSPNTAVAAGSTGINKATARMMLKEALARIGYDPAAQGVKPGSLQDWSSDARLNLVIETNADMQRGKGAHVQGRSRGAIAAFPCQELYRREARDVERDWVGRWRAAGGRFHGGGRMVALKTDAVWSALSRFGLPYPPYDYNSGMWVRPVSRRDALAMGIELPAVADLQRASAAQDPGDATEAAIPKNPELARALQRSFGDRVREENGRLILEDA